MGAKVINNSWGGPEYSQAIYGELMMAGFQNIMAVCAAGNFANNISDNPIFPANYDLDNVIVVETADAVLVASKDKAQDVKEIVRHLKDEQRAEHMVHREVFRPWGSYEGIDNGHRYQVKRLMVKPGAAISLQMHHHRAEHWIVVKGTALVTCGDQVFHLHENESTYIPIGEKHRLENPGKTPLEIIEIQSGSYLGEDDIVRFEDIYDRVQEN